MWPEETLQRHPQSLSEGFRNTNGVLGTDCTSVIKVARSHKKQEGNAQAALYEKRESVKLKEDSMTLTCCTYTDSLELELA